MAGSASGMKWGDDGGGLLISPDGVVPSRIVSVSASDISPCTIKSRRRFLLAPDHPGSPRKRALKWLCVCMCVCVCVCVCVVSYHNHGAYCLSFCFLL